MSHVDEGTRHALVDNELTPSQRATVEAHLASCGDCARHCAETTAMAHQVHILLRALDDTPAPLRIEVTSVSARAAAVVSATVTPLQHRMRLLTRVALAASMLLVAGIGYRVGVDRTSAETRRPTGAVRSRLRSAPQASVPGVVEVAPEAIAMPSEPPVRVDPHGGPRSEQEMATSDSAVPWPASGHLTVPAPTLAAISAARKDAEREDGATLPGYRMIADATTVPATRRQYVAADGVTLLLMITPTSAGVQQPTANASEFTVTPGTGRSSVRWQRAGMSYELSGALPLDSLVRLATQLR